MWIASCDIGYHMLSTTNYYKFLRVNAFVFTIIYLFIYSLTKMYWGEEE